MNFTESVGSGREGSDWWYYDYWCGRHSDWNDSFGEFSRCRQRWLE